MFSKLIFITTFLSVNSLRPNVCNKFVDYLTMDPKNCWHNPDVYSDAKTLIKRHGYPMEEYEATTEDSYLLTVYRIPKVNSKGVLFLQHPATTTCTGWIDKGNESLAFMLWNEGYDIWMGNFRGTFYSRKHKFLDPNKKEFWNFSFHELGFYDIHAQIDLVANITNVKPQGITFIGYSMSGTAGLVYASERADHAAKWLNLMILMAPSSHMEHTHPLSKPFAKKTNELFAMMNNINVHEILAHNDFFYNFQRLCRSGPTIVFCLVLDSMLFGNMPEEIQPKWFPVMHAQFPGGMSVKSFVHYMQLIDSGNKFQMFDYGEDENMLTYKTETPTQYNLSRIAVPIYLIYAENDIVIHTKDVDMLYDKLPATAKIYGRSLIRNFTHQSFFYGTHTVDRVYKPIVQMINKLYSNSLIPVNY